jgi:hypothetical protein
MERFKPGDCPTIPEKPEPGIEIGAGNLEKAAAAAAALANDAVALRQRKRRAACSNAGYRY